MADIADEVTSLLRQLIRNACVNDGSDASGGETRSVDLLRDHLGTSGFDVEVREPQPGRESLIARIEGSDPDAPSLMLMGHTDVVPANPDGWQRDPFGADLDDGFVWGRGAVDMLNLTASMAVAFRHLAADGFTPRGSLVYAAVADEENGGGWGVQWLADHEPDLVRTDDVLTELGGARLTLGAHTALPVAVAEKGAFWGTIRLSGTPGHGSLPARSDNALVKGAELVRRIQEFQPPPRFTDVWRSFVAGLALPPELSATLLDEAALERAIAELPDVGMARFLHACTHTTFAPTVMHAGVKTNVIPDTCAVDFDIRALPGETRADVEDLLRGVIGEFAPDAEIEVRQANEASTSPTDTPLWDTLTRHAQRLIPGAVTVPFLLPGATDSRFLRQLGATCYGFGMYSDRIPFGDYMRMFHGDDERIDVESLALSTDLWTAVARDLLV